MSIHQYWNSIYPKIHNLYTVAKKTSTAIKLRTRTIENALNFSETPGINGKLYLVAETACCEALIYFHLKDIDQILKSKESPIQLFHKCNCGNYHNEKTLIYNDVYHDEEE